jgi:hypothetical protein
VTTTTPPEIAQKEEDILHGILQLLQDGRVGARLNDDGVCVGLLLLLLLLLLLT